MKTILRFLISIILVILFGPLFFIISAKGMYKNFRIKYNKFYSWLYISLVGLITVTVTVLFYIIMISIII